MEEWRAVVGWEGLYEVSNMGRVRSLTRKVAFGRGWRIAEGKVLKPVPMRGSAYYRIVNLQSPERRNSTRTIAWLVLEAFVGPRPPKYDSCHGSGGTLDDRLENLRWDTRKENIIDQIRHGNHANTNKKRCPYGHLLKAPNLLKRRGRACKTCKAADYTKAATGLSKQQAMDQHYLRVMLEGVL